MSNHFHLLLTPRLNNLGQAMSYLLTNVAKYLNHQLSRCNHIFGNRYRPTIITESKHLLNVIRYLYQNPVRAGMVKSTRDYPYSSLGGYLGEGPGGLCVRPDPYTEQLFGLGTAGLQWWYEEITKPLSEEETVHIGRSLTRRYFKFTLAQTKALRRNRSQLHL